MAQLSALWLLLSLADLVLLAWQGNTILHIEQIPAIARASLVFRELLFLAAATAIIVGLFVPLQFFSQCSRPIARFLIRTISFLPRCILLFLFVASWIQFQNTGRFLDRDSIAFFLTNPIQLLQHFTHMEPFLALVVPLILVASGLLLAWMTFMLNRLSPGVNKRISLYSLMGIILLSCGIVGCRLPQLGSRVPLTDPAAGMIYTLGELYLDAREERSGPAAHALANVAVALFDKDRPIEASPEIGIEWKPILPMAKYLDKIDRGRLRQWNVIFVIVESLRTDQLRAGGSSVEVMPNVENLARSGRIYTGNYTQASHSNYADLCPLSSHYPLRSSRTHVYPKNPTYPRVMIYDILKAIGYRTAVISSQNENWGQMINYLNTGSIDHFFHAANYSGPTDVPYGDTGAESWIKGTKHSGKIDDRYTVADAIRWTGQTKSKPFFIYMNLQKSHVPYDTPADFPRRFGVEKLPCTLRFNQFPPDCAPLVRQAYANSLAYVDFQLGKLIEALKKRGQWERTIIVVTGDNGQAFFEHGFAAHANKLFDEVMRVPIVISAPGLKQGIDAQLVQHVDIPPTILDLLGLPPHPSFQGTSLLKADPSSNRSAYLVVQAPLAHQYGIVRNGLKHIYDAQGKRCFTFDLRKDPGERFNLSAREPGKYENLHRRLDTWRKAQIDYYANLQQHRKWYPPVLKD